jgi:hypothetical protein
MPRKRLFVSHISSEMGLAQYLKQRLNRDFLGSLDIFVSSDQTSIGAGTKWLDEVDKALKNADVQLILCSAESVQRPWVNFEAGAVWLRGIPVIPVCHSGLKPNDLPVPLSMLQGVEAGHPEGLERLYGAIARTLDLQVPDIDFDALANDVREVEKTQRQDGEAVETIVNPRILCAASEQYADPDLGFDLDVSAITTAFPQNVTVESALSRKRLLDLLVGQRFDIVHLVVAVDRKNGNLIFSPIDFTNYQPTTPDPEIMSPASFAALLVESQTRLVVLATCNALLLAVEVAHVSNMAASDAVLGASAAAEWAQYFYGLLAQGKPLYKAFDLTRSQTSVPIRPIRYKDVVFAPAGG